jgi:hypothetical protein
MGSEKPTDATFDGEISMTIGKAIRGRAPPKQPRKMPRSGHSFEPHASSVDRTEQNPSVQSSDYHAQTSRSTWQPTQGLVGPGLVYSGPNQTPTPEQDAASVLHNRPLNLHPHHRYLPIGKEMNKRADDAGIGCRLHTLAHLERARRRPSSKER